MSAMAAPRGWRAFISRPDLRPSFGLFRGALVASGLGLAVSTLGGWMLAGNQGLFTGLVASLMTIAFFVTGQFVHLVAMGEGSGQGLMMTLMSYGTRALLLGGILYVAWQTGDNAAVDPGSLFLAVVASISCWVAGLIWGHRRTHIPVYDVEYVAPREEA